MFIKKLSLSSLLIFAMHTLFAQGISSEKKIYNVSPKWELPVSVVSLGASYFGFKGLDKHASLTAEDVINLNTNNINPFDRPVAFNDPALFDRAHKTSDWFLNISIASPLILALDKNIRKDWLDLFTIYLSTQVVNNGVYFLSTYTVKRERPLTYNQNYDINKRIGASNTNSFFSGHVSTSAASTFFAAKVFTDYHNIKGWKRLLIYTGAAIPPGLVGYYRMRAGKHFRTDVLVGMLVGASVGIIVPELHRIKYKNDKISLSPFYGNGLSGITMRLKL